jgi:hypothetical protein
LLIETDRDAGLGAGQLDVAEDVANAVKRGLGNEALGSRQHGSNQGMVLEFMADQILAVRILRQDGAITIDHQHQTGGRDEGLGDVLEPAEVEQAEYDRGGGVIRSAPGKRQRNERSLDARTHVIIAEHEFAAVDRIEKMWTVGNIQAEGFLCARADE